LSLVKAFFEFRSDGFLVVALADKDDFSQGKKQDIAVKVLTDYAERAGGARGLEN
jgi:hypothetical protein